MPAKSLKNDEELLTAYVEGDVEAFREIYQRYHLSLFRFLMKRLGQEQNALDVLQESFLKFHRSRERLSTRYPLLQTLYVITRSEMFDFLKRRGKSIPTETKNLLDMSQNPEEKSLMREEIEELLGHLDLRQREVVLARVVWDEDFDSIARDQHLSPANVRQILKRALKKLRDGK